MEAYLNDIWSVVMSNVPQLVVAVLVLVAGWIVALLGSALTRAILKRTSVDNKLAAWATGDEKPDKPVESMAAKVVFWVLMLFALVAFFSVLGLNNVAAPLSGFLDEVFAFLPRLLSAAVLLGVAAWDPATAALVLAANLFGLAVAWFVTRVCWLPRDGSLRSELLSRPPVAGRVGPAASRPAAGSSPEASD